MIEFTTIQEVLDYFMNNKRSSKKNSLDKMKYLCSLFNHPEKKFLSVHVTGTNGKGSVVAYLRTILQEAGLNVGSFTSPYIVKFNERICYNDSMIPDNDVIRIANHIILKTSQMENDGYGLPTFFEFTTLLGFIYFSELPDLDIAIIEVGIGGRFDNTNVIDAIASIITSVSYDHMSILGPTLNDILWNKLGIANNHAPLYLTLKEDDLINKAKIYASENHIDLHLTPLTELEIIEMNLNSTRFLWRGLPYEISLRGKHQIENAILAIEVANYLASSMIIKEKSKFIFSYEILLRGLKKTNWIGRLELMNEDPLILIDGGHNDDGIRRTCEFINSLDDKKIKRAIFACSSDKERDKMIALLDQTFDEIIFTSFVYHRHTEVELLYELSKCQKKMIICDFDEIMKYIINNPVDLNMFLGSLYLISEIRPQLINFYSC